MKFSIISTIFFRISFIYNKDKQKEKYKKGKPVHILKNEK